MAILKNLVLAAALFAAYVIPAAPYNGGDLTKQYPIKHITIPCKNNFTTARKALEALVPPMNFTFNALLQAGDVPGALAALQALPPLNSFVVPPRDFGSLVRVVGSPAGRAALQYELGNPLTAAKMVTHYLPLAVHAPVRVMLTDLEGERGQGGGGDKKRPTCGFSFEAPTSTFGNLSGGDRDVLETAKYLEDLLRKNLMAACGWS